MSRMYNWFLGKIFLFIRKYEYSYKIKNFKTFVTEFFEFHTQFFPALSLMVCRLFSLCRLFTGIPVSNSFAIFFPILSQVFGLFRNPESALARERKTYAD